MKPAGELVWQSATCGVLITGLIARECETDLASYVSQEQRLLLTAAWTPSGTSGEGAFFLVIEVVSGGSITLVREEPRFHACPDVVPLTVLE